MDEHWKDKIERETRECLKHRVRQDERTNSQQKEIDEHGDLISSLHDYKNKIFQKITVLEVEKKFLPWIVMILSAAATVGMFLWTIFKAGGG